MRIKIRSPMCAAFIYTSSAELPKTNERIIEAVGAQHHSLLPVNGRRLRRRKHTRAKPVPRIYIRLNNFVSQKRNGLLYGPIEKAKLFRLRAARREP